MRCLSLLTGGLLAAAMPAARANLTFDLVPDPNTSQAAIDAFTEAAQIWSSKIADNITIRLQIGFTELPTGIVGSTDLGYYAIGAPTYDNLRTALAAHATSADDASAVASLQSGSTYSRLINNTSDNPNGAGSLVPFVDAMNWVGLTQANAKALGFTLADPTAFDGRIVFSSSYNFDFTHASIDPDAFDFVGAAVHEIGHVLGFVSGVDDIDTSGGTAKGTDYSSNMIDLFRFSAASLAIGTGVQDYTAGTGAKYFSVDGGVTAIAQFATGRTLGDGDQASHWKDDLGIGIMDPSTSYGEKLDLSATDLRAFDVMGYTLAPEPTTGLLCGLMVVGWSLQTRFRRRS